MNADDILYQPIRGDKKTIIGITAVWHNGYFLTTQVIWTDQYGNEEIIEYALPESSGS